MCPTCQGLGISRIMDPALLVEHPDKSLLAGAILAGAAEASLAALSDYGRRIGLAFAGYFLNLLLLVSVVWWR